MTTMSLEPRRTQREQQAADRFAAVTVESVRAAQAAMLAERRQIEQQFGVRFDPYRDGQLLRDRRRK